MRTRQDYERALGIIGDVIREWDPYRLLAAGAPADEFDSEIAELATHVPRLLAPDDAVEAVSTVFSAAFDAQQFSRTACREVGGRLFQRLLEEGLVPRAG